MSRASVLGLVGAPGSGRTTELAAPALPRPARNRRPPVAARRRSCGTTTCRWRDAGRWPGPPASSPPGLAPRSAGLGDITPTASPTSPARRRRPFAARRPRGDAAGPGPPLPEWTEGTVTWLRDTGSRLVVHAGRSTGSGAEFPRRCCTGRWRGRRRPDRLPACAAAARLGCGEWPSGQVVGVPSPRVIAAREPWPGSAGGGGRLGAGGGVPLSERPVESRLPCRSAVRRCRRRAVRRLARDALEAALEESTAGLAAERPRRRPFIAN
ncbi:hypothetical protein LV779_05985 [Streptomyces thinghirensis]|nr:hypothetical protein [Streptomyces thinghirensis]